MDDKLDNISEILYNKANYLIDEFLGTEHVVPDDADDESESEEDGTTATSVPVPEPLPIASSSTDIFDTSEMVKKRKLGKDAMEVAAPSSPPIQDPVIKVDDHAKQKQLKDMTKRLMVMVEATVQKWLMLRIADDDYAAKYTSEHFAELKVLLANHDYVLMHYEDDPLGIPIEELETDTSIRYLLIKKLPK